MKFFQLTPLQAAEQLNTDITKGLSFEQVALKREICGKNELLKPKKHFLKSGFLNQFKDLSIIALLVTAAISAIISVLKKDYGEMINALAIVGVVVIYGVIGTMQESKAERAMQSLEKFIIPRAKVIRGGKTTVIKTAELVPGDIVLLESGDLVPADGRIAECSFLKIDENVLTEESLPAEKNTAVIEGDNHSVGDIHNMVFAGTQVISGSAKIIVTDIGMNTQIGKIAGMLRRNITEQTPLQLQIIQMGKVLSLVVLAICALILILGLIWGKPIIDVLLTVVSLAVAVIPEGLLGIVTVMLALGVQRLAKNGVIVRKLNAVEALGSVDVICTDNTGTLTKNEMNVVSCYVRGEKFDFAPQSYKKCAELILYGSMCNDTEWEEVDGHRRCIGDPTEGGIISALECLGKSKSFLDKQYPKLGQIPFDRQRKCRSTIHVIGGRNLVIVKGAPDAIFGKCINQSSVEGAAKAEIEMENLGLRVLAVAVKEIEEIPSELFVDEIESKLFLVGLIAMSDTVHADTRNALYNCQRAGIKAVVLSGDHILTAKATAAEIGIFQDDDIALSGDMIESMTDEEFLSSVEKCSVYARISPQQRIDVVEGWQKLGKNVVVTGDRSSDAPALQRADIGCAMGLTGMDVAKDSADIILSDDKFSTLISAIRLSRGTYNNIKKAIRFLLSGNFGEMLTILVALLIFANMPLLPLPLLWINVLVTAFPAFALGMEPAREGLMNRAPRSKRESLITKSITLDVIWQGVLVAFVTLFAFSAGTGFSPRTEDAYLLSVGQTMAFAVFSFSQVFRSFDNRSRHSLLKIGLFGNKHLNLAAVISAFLVLLVMLTPGVANVFGFVSLSFGRWLLAIGLSIIPFFVCEAVKLIKKR